MSNNIIGGKSRHIVASLATNIDPQIQGHVKEYAEFLQKALNNCPADKAQTLLATLCVINYNRTTEVTGEAMFELKVKESTDVDPFARAPKTTADRAYEYRRDDKDEMRNEPEEPANPETPQNTEAMDVDHDATHHVASDNDDESQHPKCHCRCHRRYNGKRRVCCICNEEIDQDIYRTTDLPKVFHDGLGYKEAIRAFPDSFTENRNWVGEPLKEPFSS